MSEKDRELYSIIGSMLRSARESKDLTNVDVSRALRDRGINISDTSLRRYESGDRSIKVEILIELCKIYDLDYTAFMKEAQIQRLKVLDPSYHVFSKKDPNPIASTYGEDVAELIDLYQSLNDTGKAQAMLQLRNLTIVSEFTEKKKGQDKMA